MAKGRSAHHRTPRGSVHYNSGRKTGNLKSGWKKNYRAHGVSRKRIQRIARVAKRTGVGSRRTRSLMSRTYTRRGFGGQGGLRRY